MVDALAAVEPVGRPDLTAALFAGASTVAVGRLLLRPGALGGLTYRWVGVMAVLALGGAVPALGAEHEHPHEHSTHHAAEHDHAHGHEELAGAESHGGHDHAGQHETASAGAHSAGDHSPGGHGADHSAHVLAATHDATHADTHHIAGTAPHDHTAAPEPGDAHQHAVTPDPSDPTAPTDPHQHPTDPTDPTTPSDPVPITSIDDPRLTPEQFDAAVALILSTATGMSAFTTEADVIGAGYTSIGDGTQPGEYEHFVKWSYLTDEFEVDPGHIESIVMKINADGTKRVVSAMYILTLGKTMADVPDIAGELTTWHDHDNLCFSGSQLVALATNGVCPVGVLVNTPPMLHVWVEPNPCGPFAAIDEHGVTCDTAHAH